MRRGGGCRRRDGTRTHWSPSRGRACERTTSVASGRAGLDAALSECGRSRPLEPGGSTLLTSTLLGPERPECTHAAKIWPIFALKTSKAAEVDPGRLIVNESRQTALGGILQIDTVGLGEGRAPIPFIGTAPFDTRQHARESAMLREY